jgi:DNA-binding FrmR family transcriptional regulator
MVEVSAHTGTEAISERVYLSSGVEQDLRNRLNRIEGHVGGIRRMLDEREDCEHLLVQIVAVKAALNQVAIKLLDEHMSMCVATYVSTDDTEALERFTEALGIVLKRT